MSPPEVVVLDTRGDHDKQAFLRSCARALHFPDYFGQNWDAFADCLGEFARGRAPVLVVWTGASDLGEPDRGTAIDIMTERFVDGADMLIVDDVTGAPQPDFALDHVQLAIPAGGEDTARAFWVDLVGLTEAAAPTDGGLWVSGEALTLHLVAQDGFEPGTQSHPAIMVRDYDTLIDRLHTAGHDVRRDPGSPGPRNFQTDDPFGNRIQFIAF